jgi:hypothetical protein
VIIHGRYFLKVFKKKWVLVVKNIKKKSVVNGATVVLVIPRNMSPRKKNVTATRNTTETRSETRNPTTRATVNINRGHLFWSNLSCFRF